MMKKHWKAIGSGIVCVVALLAVVFTFLSTHPLVEDEQNKNVQTAALPDYDAKENYIVLEIVPDSCYKQLSYLEAGNEPVDIFEVSNKGKANEIAEVAGNGVQLVEVINGVQYQQIEEIYGTDKVEANFVKTVTGAGAYAKQTKYELKSSTAEEKKSFPINKNILADKFSSLIYGKGVEDIQVVSVTSAELNGADIDKVKALVKAADVIVMNQSYVAGAEEAHKDLGSLVKNSEGGKKFVDNDLNWDVTSALYERLSSKKKPVTFFMDSSIYQNALSKSEVSVDTVQYKLNREVKYKDGKFNKNYTKVGDDGLFNASTYPAGSGKKASNNNAYKLFLMSMFRDPIEFYNLFMESGLIAANGKSYELQTGNAAEYWNTYTFLPCTGDLASDKGKFEAANEAYWTDSMGITLELSSENYINCNIVSFDAGKESLISGLSSKEAYKISGKSATKEYSLLDIMDLLEDYTPKANVSGKEYKVLELQPAKGYDLSPVAIERMIPYTSYSSSSSISLEITQMTTAEFIGRTDDLTSCYDMIYIGDNTSGLWDKDNKTYYGKNNTDMEGVIYAHVGAKVNFGYGTANTSSSSADGNSNGRALFAKEDSGCLRFSGNDITDLKKKELETYLGTQLPIVVASGLCKDAEKSEPSYFNFPTYNNMRNFLKGNKDDLMDLQFNYRTASAKELEEQLTRLTKVKPTLKVTKMSSSGGTFTDSQLDKTVYFTFNSTSSDRKITFTYDIEDEGAGDAYTLEFYIDKNADGRFVSTERVGRRSTTAGTGRSYSFNINTNYRGAFTWKLVAYPNNNKTLTCSQIGYGTIKFSDVTGGKDVKVLQVVAVKGEKNADDTYTKHGTKWGYDKAVQLNLEYDTFFKDLFDGIRDDYDITVESIDMQAFTYGADGKHPDGYWKKNRVEHTRKTLISDYDMIIFGFADSYRDAEFNKTEIAKDIDDYIAAGKSVLFTHDLTSQINDADILMNGQLNGNTAHMETTNGNGFNQYMRDSMGLNRFNQNVKSDSTKDASKAYDSMKDAERSDTDKYGFTYTTLLQYSNFRRAWPDSVESLNSAAKSGGFYGPYKNLLVSLGTNNKTENDNNGGWPDIFNGHYSELASDEAKRTESYSENTAIQGYGTNYISNVNNGQITSYPYDLSTETGSITSDGRYKIALTHGQYYQLNMEDEEIVCWYTLSDQNASGKGWYSSSPNDVANNYYIYNKKNVTYSGVGHSNSTAMTDFERKLFVNTIVAALRAGVEGPGATVTNGFNVPEKGEDRYVVYADVDVDSPADEFTQAQDVEFYVTDDGTEKSQVYVAIEWYEKDSDGNYVYKEKSSSELAGLGVSLKADTGSTAPAVVNYTRTLGSGSSAKTETHNGIFKVAKSDESGTSVKGYILKIPRKYLKTQSSQEFRIVVYDDEGAMGYTNAAIVRRPLFKLD